jgi:hypothetical protein
MRLDKFTWAVIGAVALLLVAAIVTVNLTGGAGTDSQNYLPPDTPEAPVFNAFLAFQRGDITTARAQYNPEMIAQMQKDQGGYDPFTARGNMSNSNRRLRITDTQLVADDADRALVSVVIDNYSGGGLFGSSNSWSQELTLEVVRVEDGWKLNSQEFFY